MNPIYSDVKKRIRLGHFLGAIYNFWGDTRFEPSNAHLIGDYASGYGTETAETERMNWVCKSWLVGPLVLKAYRMFTSSFYEYVDTVATNYHYCLYIRPVMIEQATGAVKDLDVERLMKHRVRGAVTTAGWVRDDVVGALVDVRRLNIMIPEGWLLGFRLRTTSWADVPANNGHGFAQHGSISFWWTYVDVEHILY